MINSRLSVRRENPTDEIIQNMVHAYRYVDTLVMDKVQVFSTEGLHHLLELNHIVLCGTDPIVRMEYGQHIEETRKRFSIYIKPIFKWYKKHEKSTTAKVAAEVYVGVLSRPQLFFEGNHRTGSLIASYIMLMNSQWPFVLNMRNAIAYFEPSSHIKFSNKSSIKGKLKLPKYQKEFRRFLEEQLSGDYVLPQ